MIILLSGSKLQYLRRLKGFTQVYMAESIGISERWVGKIENEGERPSQEVYDKWLLTIYGKLKPVKKEKSESPKLDCEKKTTNKKKK
ncbi:MAG: helix-turn-helix transcriptional regulator [Clostridiales bacterium]|mgnify:FL=1|nr:helix-turn-helix transcriptional regulator [Clostridiales bacterium]